MNQYLIYGLRCPKTDDYKYIGKSSSGMQRAQAHLTYSHNESVNYWVAELREQGFCPLIDVIEECSTDVVFSYGGDSFLSKEHGPGVSKTPIGSFIEDVIHLDVRKDIGIETLVE